MRLDWPGKEVNITTMRGRRQFGGWTVDLHRGEFRRIHADGAREVVPFASKRGSELNGALWHRDMAIPRIPREDWWLARFTNILIESFSQWVGEDIIDYETATIIWFVRQVYWAGKRDGARGIRKRTR